MNGKFLLSGAVVAILGFYGNAIAGGDKNCSEGKNGEASYQCDQLEHKRMGLKRSKSERNINADDYRNGDKSEDNGKAAPRRTLKRSKSGGDIDVRKYKKTVEEE